MDIKLDISRHCLETECKKIYDRLISQYFKKETKREKLEPILQSLGNFLEKTNFACLRAQYKELSGGYEHEATLRFHRERTVVKLKDKDVAIKE